jgi:hypothetical protein
LKSYSLSWPWVAVIVAALAAATAIAVALITEHHGRISPWWLLPTGALALATGAFAASAASRLVVMRRRRQLELAHKRLRLARDQRDDAVERLREVLRRLEVQACDAESRAP